MYFEAYSGITEPHSDIFRTMCNPCMYNCAIFKTLADLEPETSSKVCKTCQMIRHIQSPGMVRTVYSSIFKDIQGYSGVLMHIRPYSQAYNQKGDGGVPLPFFENRKKCRHFGKKGADCVHLWVKFSPQNFYFSKEYQEEKTPKYFPAGFFSLVFVTKCLSKCPDSMKPHLP